MRVEIEGRERDEIEIEERKRKSIEAISASSYQNCYLLSLILPSHPILSYPLSYPVASMGK